MLLKCSIVIPSTSGDLYFLSLLNWESTSFAVNYCVVIRSHSAPATRTSHFPSRHASCRHVTSTLNHSHASCHPPQQHVSPKCPHIYKHALHHILNWVYNKIWTILNTMYNNQNYESVFIYIRRCSIYNSTSGYSIAFTENIAIHEGSGSCSQYTYCSPLFVVIIG